MRKKNNIDWEREFHEQKQSQLTKIEWCKQRGYSQATFWRKCRELGLITNAKSENHVIFAPIDTTTISQAANKMAMPQRTVEEKPVLPTVFYGDLRLENVSQDNISLALELIHQVRSLC